MNLPRRPSFPFRCWHAFVVAACALLVVGCNQEGPQRYDVRGQVTYEGNPVPYGRILFEPSANSGGSGPQGYALIEGGRFSTSRTGKGCVGGPHEVIITGFDGVAINDDAPFGQLMFPTYRTSHDFPLETLVVDFEIPQQQ